MPDYFGFTGLTNAFYRAKISNGDKSPNPIDKSEVNTVDAGDSCDKRGKRGRNILCSLKRQAMTVSDLKD